MLAAGGGMWTVGPNDPLELPFSVESAAALSAMPDAGHRFAGWTGPCEGSGPVCLLDKGAAKPVTADATVRALFELAALTLTVAAGAGGSVAVDVDGAAVGTVGPDFREGFGLGVGSTATLTAMPDAGWAFAGWTLSGDRAPACADGGAASRCVLAAGSVAAGAGVAAMFEAAATTLTVAAGTGGSVEVDVDGAAATRTVAAAGHGRRLQRRARPRRSWPCRTPAGRSPAGRCRATGRRRAPARRAPTHAGWRPARSPPTRKRPPCSRPPPSP